MKKKVIIEISTDKQRLYLYSKGAKIRTFRISTSKYGTGNAPGSQKTPLGRHRICKKIGKNEPEGMVFKDRLATGDIWDGKSLFGDLILSRILWLEGLEKGKNHNTKKRYIYIHGTNHVKSMGKPASHGCIIMAPDKIIELFDLVSVGDTVDIT